MNTQPPYKFEWTPDCQGKQDYDKDIIHLSTRYWPRGGSAHIYQGGKFVSDKDSPERQHIRPSAHSSIYFLDHYDDPLVEKRFEGETEEDVKKQVEEWADFQIRRLKEYLPLFMQGVVMKI